MSCADVCLNYWTEGENNSFSQKVRTARTAKRCCECNDAIAPKEKYERAVGSDNGKVWHVDTCMPCMEVRDAFSCGSWIYGELWERAAEDLFPKWRHKGNMVDCLAKLDSFAARQKCRRKYAEWLGE